MRRLDGIYAKPKTLKTVGFSFGQVPNEVWVFARADHQDLVEYMDILQSQHIKSVTRRTK